MARQQNRTYEPELANLSNSNSPLSPPSRGDTPVTFRTNVNRAKTKRWVEAKKYSYDGNDWGEDEYDEYDDDPTPPMPHYPPNANQSTGNLPGTLPRDVARPPVSTTDRSRSMDQVDTLGPDRAGDSRNQVETSNTRDPIVRPADIYRRMQQDPSMGDPLAAGHPNDIPTRVGPYVTESVPKSSGPSGDQLPHRSLDATMGEMSAPEKQTDGTPTQNDHPALELPDVKRLSGFGPNFYDGSAPIIPNPHPIDPLQDGHNLQHNPSMGFRSAVHQAFDVPETPSTTVDSVARSNSDSTSGISPIIGSRAFGGEDKTPTIVEEPESTSPPKDFKFGHRRDMSVPSPGNSPSRQPVITNNDTVTASALAETSTHTPYGSPKDLSMSHHSGAYETSAEPSSNMPATDRPPPLKINVSTESNGGAQESVPVIIPSMSTDNSPEDTDNDRLRKEIIRSLSRENTPSDEPEAQDRSRPQTGRQDSLIPSEYERYWSEQTQDSPQEQRQEEIPAFGHSTAQNTSQDPYSGTPEHAPAPSSTSESRPKMKRRFSWETSSSSDDPAPVADAQSPPGVAMPGQFPVASESSAQPDVANEPEAKDTGRQEKPKLTIITPSAMDSSSISSGLHESEAVGAQPIPDSANSANRRSAELGSHSSAPAPTAPPSIESSLLGFRDILNMKTSDDRVQAFNNTRDQFASIDTGLNHWIQVTVHDHPQHTDVVAQSWNQSSAAPKYTASRGKFPKLPSLGNFGASNPDGSPSGSGHVRRPSAPLGSMMNKQQVEQRGKDLLHTAGVLGGKAGEAAKGLFAKGRSKFKGGNEKVEP
ncbi:hypothetical protein FE257_000395 [Aspergillus nanangensis]|uniref:Uncharacterized protein n=1 Tax=Aspergillus nanangensis TaxID=2582783 RepID=A0AAD4CUJ2_ASPNN|nr:hypothetical protein FE257_000395 [Aspergillus nanangensis]